MFYFFIFYMIFLLDCWILLDSVGRKKSHFSLSCWTVGRFFSLLDALLDTISNSFNEKTAIDYQLFIFFY